MTSVTVFLSLTLKRRLHRIARWQRRNEPDVLQEALEKGLAVLERQQTASLVGLRKLADFAEEHPSGGPVDLSRNLDRYLWDDDET